MIGGQDAGKVKRLFPIERRNAELEKKYHVTYIGRRL